MVASFPLGTRRISSSTSTGAGITNVPNPQRLLLVESILQTLGNPLLSASFSLHVLLFVGIFAPVLPGVDHACVIFTARIAINIGISSLATFSAPALGPLVLFL